MVISDECLKVWLNFWRVVLVSGVIYACLERVIARRMS